MFSMPYELFIRPDVFVIGFALPVRRLGEFLFLRVHDLPDVSLPLLEEWHRFLQVRVLIVSGRSLLPDIAAGFDLKGVPRYLRSACLAQEEDITLFGIDPLEVVIAAVNTVL